MYVEKVYDMVFKKMYDVLDRNGVVFIEDDYEEVAVRLVRNNGSLLSYIKRKGGSEIRTTTTSKMVFDTIISGKEISSHEYDKY